MLKKILLSTALSVAVAGGAFAQSPSASDKRTGRKVGLDEIGKFRQDELCVVPET